MTHASRDSTLLHVSPLFWTWSVFHLFETNSSWKMCQKSKPQRTPTQPCKSHHNQTANDTTWQNPKVEHAEHVENQGAVFQDLILFPWTSVSTSWCSRNSVKRKGFFVSKFAPSSFTKHGCLIWRMMWISCNKSLVECRSRSASAGLIFLGRSVQAVLVKPRKPICWGLLRSFSLFLSVSSIFSVYTVHQCSTLNSR